MLDVLRSTADDGDGNGRDLAVPGLRLVESQACRRCKETKSLEEFQRDRSRPNGRRTICKECRSEAEHPVRPRVVEPSAAMAAWFAAADRLVANHEREFRSLLYTERGLRGLTDVVLPKSARGRDPRR